MKKLVLLSIVLVTITVIASCSDDEKNADLSTYSYKVTNS